MFHLSSPNGFVSFTVSSSHFFFSFHFAPHSSFTLTMHCCYSIRVQSHEMCQSFFSAQIFTKQIFDSHFGSLKLVALQIPKVMYKLTHTFFFSLSMRVKTNPKYKITTLKWVCTQIQFNYIEKYGSQFTATFSTSGFLITTVLSHKIRIQF